MNIEFKAESLANQLGAITNRPRMEPFTPVIFMKTFMDKLKERVGKEVRVGVMPVSQMDIHHLVYSINRRVAEDFTNAGLLATTIRNFMPTVETANVDTLRNILRELMAGIDEYKTIMANVVIGASANDIFQGSQETLQTLRSGQVGQFGRLSAAWRRLVMDAAEPPGPRSPLIARLSGVRGDKPPVNPRGTMYFSKLKPEVVGRRPGDIRVEREALYRGAALAADIAAVGTRIRSLPPITMTEAQFLRMSAGAKEALLKQYGVKLSGSNRERYARLYAINR
jgi:hypothetical protein